MWGNIGYYIVRTALSFSFSLSENPVSNYDLFVKQIYGKMKWTKDQVHTDVVWNFIKNKAHEMKFIYLFLCRPACAALVIYLVYVQNGGRS